MHDLLFWLSKFIGHVGVNEGKRKQPSAPLAPRTVLPRGAKTKERRQAYMAMNESVDEEVEEVTDREVGESPVASPVPASRIDAYNRLLAAQDQLSKSVEVSRVRVHSAPCRREAKPSSLQGSKEAARAAADNGSLEDILRILNKTFCGPK